MKISQLCCEIKVREPQPRYGVMSRDIINNGGTGFAAGAGDDNPTSDLSGAASKRVRIEFKQMTQCFTVSAPQLLEHPAVQRCIDPTRARAAWIVGKST